MASKIEGLPIAHGAANSNASLGLKPNAAHTAAMLGVWKSPMRPPRDYRWNQIETAPLDEDVRCR
jgi:hypothetical protein